MTTNAALLATRYARRPLLLTPDAASELASRIRAVDDRAFARPGRLQAFLRRVGLAGGGEASGARAPMAMEDDDWMAPPPIHERLAYSPLWAGEVDDLGFCWALKNGVALMNCDTPLVENGEEFCGVVYHGYDTLLEAMQTAVEDSRVEGIFLRLSCPGGVVAGGLPTLAAFMRETRAAAGGKPIHVYADMACSAAYWIAAQADRISAPGVGLVGSIGAVLVHEDWSGALEKAGVVITSVEFPAGGSKTDAAWWKALGPAAQADLESMISQCGADFVADVVAGRPQFTAEALLATQARVFLARNDDAERSGLALGFVDSIESEQEAFEALLADISDPVSTPRPSISPFAAQTGSAGGALTSEEEPMAIRQPARGPATASQPRANAAAPPVDDGDTEDMTDGGVDDAEEDDNGDPVEDPKAPAAAAIAASAEAKAHPGLALAAIQSGQSLAQFQATVAAMAGAPRTSKLDAAMAGSPRLGPAGAKPPQAGGGGKQVKPAADYYAARKQAVRQAGGRG